MRKPVAFAVLGLAWTGVAWSQGSGVDWTTSGNDAQRTSWVRSDAKISVESVHQPDFRLAWKIKLDNEPRQRNALTPPVLLDYYIGYRGFRSLAFLAGSSGRVFAIDTDLARMEWQKSLSSGSPPRDSSLDCPGGMTANLSRPTAAGLPPPFGIRGAGRRSGAAGGVGEPNQGAVTLAEAGRSNFSFPPPSNSPRVRPTFNPYAPVPSYVYALATDGMLHTMFVSNGEAGAPPLKFLAPNANAHGLIVVDGVAYVATTNGCGGVANGVWALDIGAKKIASWKSPGGVAGMGPAFGPEGTIYVATGAAAGSPASSSNSLVALKPKTLEPIGSYTADRGFTSTPVVIDYNDKDVIAVAAQDGRIHLLDGANLGGADHRTPLHKTPAYTAEGGDFIPGALAAWKDSAGTNWVLAPAAGPPAAAVKFPLTNGEVTNGAIVAWKVVEENGTATLQPGWVSRDIASPLPPIVVNGVVFAAASGEFRTSDRSITAAQRAQRSSRAVLYALDGATGKLLWESGDAITSFASGGLSAGGSTVYVGAYDGTLYAFGFPIEH